MDHIHTWEAKWSYGFLTGTPYRRCIVEGCRFITLDGWGEDITDDGIR